MSQLPSIWQGKFQKTTMKYKTIKLEEMMTIFLLIVETEDTQKHNIIGIYA